MHFLKMMKLLSVAISAVSAAPFWTPPGEENSTAIVNKDPSGVAVRPSYKPEWREHCKIVDPRHDFLCLKFKKGYVSC